MVVEGQSGRRSDRVRVELTRARDDRCVYDLLYVAPLPPTSRGGRRTSSAWSGRSSSLE